jgi:plasmid stabilization system protein ParE
MTSKGILSLAAEQDIDEIITYLAQESPVVARTFLDSLFAAMDNLAKFPELGHLREDLTDKPVKFWTFKWHYLIIYKATSPIEIVRVLSGFRDIINLMG